MLQQKLKEAQQKEQELNAELRQYRDDLEATKVLYTVTLGNDCATVWQLHQSVYVYDCMMQL